MLLARQPFCSSDNLVAVLLFSKLMAKLYKNDFLSSSDYRSSAFK